MAKSTSLLDKVAAYAAIAAATVAVLYFLFGGNLPDIIGHGPTRFSFQYEGIPESEEPTYEVTEELRYVDDDLGHFDIMVSADGATEDIRGTVEIFIRRPDGTRTRVLAACRREAPLRKPDSKLMIH
jgi:hypothetical protein